MRPAAILVRSSAAGAPGGPPRAAVAYLPVGPQLARDAADRPRLSLTLVLARQPRPDEPDLLPLIRLGLLSVEVTLAVPEAALAEVPAAAGLVPLFARDVRFRLVDAASGEVLASVRASGPRASGALSATLERPSALDALAALDGTPGGLVVEATVAYATVPVPVVIRLSGQWATVYDGLEERGMGGALSLEDVRTAFRELVRDGRIMITEEREVAPPGSSGEDDTAFEAFLNAAAFLLERSTEDAEAGGAPSGAAATYRLRRRPPDSMPLEISRSEHRPGAEIVELQATLAELLGGSLDSLERDRYIRLVGPGGGDGIEPTPPVSRSTDARRETAARSSVPVQSSEQGMRSLSLALLADRTVVPDAHEMLRSDTFDELPARGRLRAWLADDLVLRLEHGGEQPLALPIVADASGPLWPDRLDPSTFWYAPEFAIDVPATSDEPATAAFLFGFVRSGVTAGPDPKPGLDATVRLRLRSVTPAAVTAALTAAGDPSARPVATDNLAVSLDVPFRDGSGATLSQAFVAEVETAGDAVTATVELLDSWVRLAYGALAFSGFQARPPAIHVAYAYRAYVPVHAGDIAPVFGGKIARLEMIADRGTGPGELAVRVPGGVLRFEPTPGAGNGTNGARRATAPAAASARGATLVATAFRPEATLVASRVEPTLVSAARFEPVAVLRPELSLSAALASRVQDVTYATRTLVRDQSLDVVMPCSTLGAFYRSGPADGSVAVGCQDALRLGEIAYRQYEEVAALAGERFRVFRSLQQPGRFLVLPARYRITRYGPSEPGRAYRPVILVYSVLDAVRGSRYFLSASLQPDLAPFERRDLLDLLVAYSPQGHEPQLDLPTDPAIQSQLSYEWAKPPQFDEPTVLQVWGGFQVTVSAGVIDALLLTTMIEHDGLNGTVRFHLPDGQDLRSALSLDTRVVGPWLTGPLEVAGSGGSATLTNRIERSVNVFDLVVRRVSGVDRVAVDRTIAPGASISVATAPTAEMYPSYAVVEGSVALDELDIFPEDVDTTLIFVNLLHLADHGLTSIAVNARLPGQAHADRVELPEAKSASLAVVFPLTTYLYQHTVEFQVERTGTDGTVTTTGWQTWDLKEKGVVISIDATVIA